MCGKGLDRKPVACRAVRLMAALVLVTSVAGPARGADDGAGNLWDSVLEKLNVKTTPAATAPDFVRRTRPDPETLGYTRTAVPHKVSPLPVKSAAEIDTKKAALDAAKAAQLLPHARPPIEIAKFRKKFVEPDPAGAE